MKLLLWLSICAILWSYAGYPIFLFFLSKIVPRRLRVEDIEPAVTVIIAAHNEEKVIARKVLDTLALEYPKAGLDVLVAADGCTDATCSIVDGLADPRARALDLRERNGKSAAQNAAAAEARGEILVFTDATTNIPPDAIRRLVRYFADPAVGCVGAELEYVSREGTAVGAGGSAYWRYEKALKRMEASVNSLIGVSGCLYAVRASSYRPIDQDLISDFVIASDIAAQGQVTAYAEGVVAVEETHERTDREFQMRVRVAVRSIHALVRKRAMLNPIKHGFFAVQLLSHKVLRYLVPVFLLTTLGLSIAVVITQPSGLYIAMLAAQVLVYLAAAAQYALLRWGLKWRPFYVPFYLLHTNMAALWALVAYLRGERAVTWTPVR